MVIRQEEEKWKRKMDLHKEAIAKARYVQDVQNEAIVYQREVQLRSQQASQMAEMQSRNQQTFFSLMTEQVKLHQQIVIAQQNKPNWLKRTLGIIGGPIGGIVANVI